MHDWKKILFIVIIHTFLFSLPNCSKEKDNSLFWLLLFAGTGTGTGTGTGIGTGTGTTFSYTPPVPGASCSMEGAGATYGGPATGRLMITEVGYKFNIIANWFEIHNGTGAPVNLSNYSVRVSNTWSSVNSSYGGERTYPLPAITIPEGSYIIIRARLNSRPDDEFIISLIDADTYYPFWLADGYIELISGGVTVDFVRFGTGTGAPTTAGEWSGAGTSALTDTYTASLQRNSLQNDTNTAADWSWVAGITPNLPNETLCSTDADLDGFPDCAEQNGRGYLGMPLYKWGARTGQRDMFIEVDYMRQDSPDCKSCPDAGLIPNEISLKKLTEKYAANGIAAHFDVGDLFDNDGITGNNPDRFDLCNAGFVPFTIGVAFGSSSGVSSVFEMKEQYMDKKRKNFFYYTFYSYSDKATGSVPNYAGIAQVSAGHLIMALSQRNLKFDTNSNTNYHTHVLFHELGHNLGLWHGGDDSRNNKINYISDMNYLYGYNFPTIGTDEPWKYYFSYVYENTACKSLYTYYSLHSMNDSPDTFPFDYSDGSSSSIDENAVSEAAGVGRSGGLAIDFNCNGTIDGGTVVKNLDSNAALESITDHDDWSAVSIFFAGLPVTRSPWNLSSPFMPFSSFKKHTPTRQSMNPFLKTLPGLIKDSSISVKNTKIAGLQKGKDGLLYAVPAVPGSHVWIDREKSEQYKEIIFEDKFKE